MLVSTISSGANQTVFNTRATKQKDESYYKTVLDYLHSYSASKNISNRNRIFDCINEWKYFCHYQIEKGNFDIIV